MTSKSAIHRRGPGRIPEAELAAHNASLLETASRLFRRHGYAGTTIDLIAAEARVSPKTLYARFNDKLGLFTAVVEQLVRSPLQIWETIDAAADPAAELVRTGDAFLAQVLSPEVLGMERTVLAEAERLPHLATLLYERGPRRGLQELARYFAAQHRRGRLHVRNPHAAADLFAGMLEGELVRRALFLGEVPSPARRRAWVRYVVQAFLLSCASGGAAPPDER